MASNTKEFTWVIRPKTTPLFIHNCSKCNAKMEFYCSEKFRLNGNHTKIDIWLIYKCIKCRTTWKHVIFKGIKPKDISKELFDNFTNNDKETAWKYAFDLQLIRMNCCVPDYSQIDYTVEGYDPVQIKAGPDENIIINLTCPFKFDLKLSRLLAKLFQISNRDVRHLVENKIIQFDLPIKIHKYRIRNDLKMRINIFNFGRHINLAATFK